MACGGSRTTALAFAFVEQVARLRQSGAVPSVLQHQPHRTSGVTAVVSTWNKCADLRENLLALEAQTLPFDEIVVVDVDDKGTPHVAPLDLRRKAG